MYSYKALSIVVLILLFGGVSLSVYSLVANTWWVGEFTAKAPLYNVTYGRPYVIFIGINIRAGLLKTCWHVEQTNTSFDYKFNGTFLPAFRTCIDEKAKSFKETRACVITSLVFCSLVVLLQSANIFVGNTYLVKANIAFSFLGAMFQMAALIVFNENVNYHTLFVKEDIESIPRQVVQHDALHQNNRHLLTIVFRQLYKSRPKNRFTKGDAFTFLWSAEILLFASFIFLIMEYFFASRSGDKDYAKGLSKKAASPKLLPKSEKEITRYYF